MQPEVLAAIRDVLQLGWPALVTVFLVVLWRRMNELDDKLHACLEQHDAEL